MNRIIFRVAVALLTFIVGIAAVSLWYFSRRDVEKRKIESSQLEKIAKRGNSLSDNIPNVKWLYIKDSIEWSDGQVPKRKEGYGFITIFYENGDWARVHVLVNEVSEDYRKYFDIKVEDAHPFIDEKGNKRNKIDLSFSNGDYGVEFGSWKEENDGIKVNIKRCICYRCEEFAPLNGYTKEQLKNPLPIIESWIFKENKSESNRAIIESPIEKYRLLRKGEFLNLEQLDELLSASTFWMKKELHGLGEPCSKHYEYKNRFNTMSE